MALSSDEIGEFLDEVAKVYPRFKDTEQSVDAWIRYLSDVPDVQTLMHALDRHIAASPRFAPTIGEIRRHALECCGGRFKSEKYQEADQQFGAVYDDMQEQRGLIAIYERSPAGHPVRRFVPVEYTCNRNGRRKLKINYVMDQLGGAKVSEILRQELHVMDPAKLPDEMKKKNFSERYQTVLADLMDLADTLEQERSSVF